MIFERRGKFGMSPASKRVLLFALLFMLAIGANASADSIDQQLADVHREACDTVRASPPMIWASETARL